MIPNILWTYRARLGRVIDGDTYELVVDLGFGLTKSSADNDFRLKGVDCPEKFGATRAAGLAAMEFAISWFRECPEANWPLVIQTEKAIGKDEVQTMGRWVADIWRVLDGASLSESIIKAGHGTGRS